MRLLIAVFAAPFEGAFAQGGGASVSMLPLSVAAMTFTLSAGVPG